MRQPLRRVLPPRPPPREPPGAGGVEGLPGGERDEHAEDPDEGRLAGDEATRAPSPDVERGG